ncbi:MAG: FG-GAP repeat domain-containing protein [Candidatus Acidiferrales bacterium]
MKRRIGLPLWLIAVAGLLYAASHAQQPPLLSRAGAPLRVGPGPADPVAGHFDRDGKLDIALANSGANSVTILLGDGRSGLREAPGSPFNAGPKPHLLAAGDFNRDGKFDLAVTEHDSNDVRVFLGHGNGRFAAAPGSPFAALTRTPPHNHGLSAGDVNGDGKLDLITSNQNDHSVSVLLGDGRGGFAPASGSPFAVGRAPYPHALADVNGDRKLDIVSPNVGGDSVAVLLGDGSGRFAAAPGSPIGVLARPYYAAVADLNGDKHADAAIIHDDTSRITILLGDGRGSFRPAPSSPVDAGRRGAKTIAHDLNRDGKPDLVIAAGDSIVVLLGDGRGRFAPAPGSPYGTAAGTWGIALANLDGSGPPEIISVSFERNELAIWRTP